MITYRPFRNSDPPALVGIWRAAPGMHGLAQNLTVEMFDSLVLSKPYFDPAGLLLASDDDKPVGFVHAGFGPSEHRSCLDQRRGVISMLMLLPDDGLEKVAAELIERAEQYLYGRGAEEIFAIGVGEICPFYLGLYGGSDLPGVLVSDTARQALFRAQGYEEVDRVRVFQRQLVGFRPKVDRAQLQIGRTTTVDLINDPPPRSWWEACTHACFDQVRVELRPRGGGPAMAVATFWDMESLDRGSDAHTIGLAHIDVAAEHEPAGPARYLLGKSLRKFQPLGFSSVEGQAMHEDENAKQVFETLGFTQIDSGSVLRK